MSNQREIKWRGGEKKTERSDAAAHPRQKEKKKEKVLLSWI